MTRGGKHQFPDGYWPEAPVPHHRDLVIGLPAPGTFSCRGSRLPRASDRGERERERGEREIEREREREKENKKAPQCLLNLACKSQTVTSATFHSQKPITK